jgi:Spy/CpxP family protein refolding chaperone
MKRRTGIIIAMLCISVLLGAEAARAQQQPAQTPRPPHKPVRPVQPTPAVPSVPNVPNLPNVDPLSDAMFSPSLIMRHARELGLTDEQKTFMRGEIQKTTTRFNELQWQLHEAMETLHQTLKSDSVNDGQALTELDKVLEVEREIKRLHILLGIRLKNTLTPEQRERLNELRKVARLSDS